MNDCKWNLDSLYTGFDSPQFKNDFESLKSQIKHITRWAEENLTSTEDSSQKALSYINFENQLGLISSRLMEYTALVLSEDAHNSTALKYSDILEDTLSDISASTVLFIKWIKSISDIDALINSCDELKTHEYFLNQCKEQAHHTLNEMEETILSKLRSTGSSSWTKLHETITSTLNIKLDINGNEEIHPLPAVRNMAYSNDPIIRKTAYMVEIKALESIAQTSAACLNGIKGEVITVAKLKNYTSPLHMTLLDSRMDKESLDAMLGAINDNLDLFKDYFLKKAELLGHKNGLPFYDLFAPIGTVNLEYSYEYAQNIIIENFGTFSPELADYAKKAFQNNWIDPFPREGKRGGAFCSNLHSIGESRILTNFTGSFSDVITLAHELGHGYHGEMLNSQTYLNSDYPMPIAETASTFCETIVKNALLAKVEPEQKKIILENDISDNAQIIVDIMSRFLFEDKVFELRKDGSLSPTELCEIMLDAQNKTYQTGLDKEFFHKYMWVCKPHYYDAQYNYYNFPYAFGLLFAKGLYAQYLANKATFCEKYDQMLALTGKTNLSDVGKFMGIDLQSKEFWNNSLDIITSDIKEFCKL